MKTPTNPPWQPRKKKPPTKVGGFIGELHHTFPDGISQGFTFWILPPLFKGCWRCGAIAWGTTRLETKVDFALDGVGLDDHIGGTLLARSLVHEVFARFRVSHIVLTNGEPHEALGTVLLLGLVVATHNLGGSLGGEPALRAVPKQELGTGTVLTTGRIAVNVHEAVVLRNEEREGLTHLLSVGVTNPIDIVDVLGSGGIVVGGLCHTQFLGL